MSEQPVYIKVRVEVSGPDGVESSEVHVDRDLVGVIPPLANPARLLLREGLVPLEQAITRYLRRA